MQWMAAAAAQQQRAAAAHADADQATHSWCRVAASGRLHQAAGMLPTIWLLATFLRQQQQEPGAFHERHRFWNVQATRAREATITPLTIGRCSATAALAEGCLSGRCPTHRKCAGQGAPTALARQVERRGRSACCCPNIGARSARRHTVRRCVSAGVKGPSCSHTVARQRGSPLPATWPRRLAASR